MLHLRLYANCVNLLALAVHFLANSGVGVDCVQFAITSTSESSFFMLHLRLYASCANLPALAAFSEPHLN